MKVQKIVFAAVVLAAALLGPAAAQQQQQQQDPGFESAYRFMQNCGDSGLSMCLKSRALSFFDDALAKGDISLVDGVTIVQDSRFNSERALHENVSSLPRAGDESQVEGLLLDRAAKFLSTHTLQFKVPEAAISGLKRSIEEGRKKKKDYLLPFILALKLKAVALVPLILGAIALLALKALVVGKIALVLSALIGLQKLLANQHSTKTVEVVAHPTYSHESHGHYKRALDLAYSAHQP